MDWRLASICVTVAALTAAHAQQPATSPQTFRTGISIVEVVAVVTGEDGRSLTDLAAADFEVFEDGEPRPIVTVKRLTSAAAATRRPVTTPAAGAPIVEQLATNAGVSEAPAFVLLLDDLNTSPYDAHRVIRAAEGALRAIPEEALVAVLTTSGLDGSLLTLAPPGPAHLARIRAFRGQLLLSGPPAKRFTPQTTPSSVNAPCGVGSAVLQSQACGDPTRGARRAETLAAAARILGRAGARRKALFWLTPDMGVSPLNPDGDRRAQTRALVQAISNDVAVYAIDPRENITAVEKGDDRPDQRTGGTYRVGPGATLWQGGGGGVIDLDTDDMVAVPLTQIARESGGRYIAGANDLEKELARVVEQNGTSYLLAYESPVSRVAGGHRIDVRVRRAGARVFARRGYFVAAPASDPADADPSPHARVLRDTLMGSVPRGGLPLVVHVAPQFATGRQGRAVVTVRVDEGGAREEPVTVALATIDEGDRFGNQRQITLSPPAPGRPWEISTELTLARGRHQLRVAAVTADASRTGLVIVPVDIVEPGRQLAMSPPVLLDSTEGHARPTAGRTFAAGQPLGVQVEVGGRPAQQKSVAVRAALLDSAGRAVREADAVLDAAARPDRVTATAVLATGGIAGGDYLLMVEARSNGSGGVARRSMPITLEAPRPPAAPASSRTIAHTVVAHGPSSWHAKPGTALIRTEREWSAFWKHLPTRQSAPSIDFERVTLLAIVLETGAQASAERPTVSRIEQTDGAAVVYWQTAAMMRPAGAPAGAPLRPFIVVAVTERLQDAEFRRGPF